MTHPGHRDVEPDMAADATAVDPALYRGLTNRRLSRRGLLRAG